MLYRDRRQTPTPFEAKQLLLSNIAEVREWCHGTTWSEPPMRAVTGIQFHGACGLYYHVRFGDYVYVTPSGSRGAMAKHAFEDAFEPVVGSHHSVVEDGVIEDAGAVKAEAQREIDILRALLHPAPLHPAPLPCGHPAQYGHTEDSGKTIWCCQCRLGEMRQALARSGLVVDLLPRDEWVTQADGSVDQWTGRWQIGEASGYAQEPTEHETLRELLGTLAAAMESCQHGEQAARQRARELERAVIAYRRELWQLRGRVREAEDEKANDDRLFEREADILADMMGREQPTISETLGWARQQIEAAREQITACQTENTALVLESRRLKAETKG